MKDMGTFNKFFGKLNLKPIPGYKKTKLIFNEKR